jgi:hypothetical protein
LIAGPQLWVQAGAQGEESSGGEEDRKLRPLKRIWKHSEMEEDETGESAGGLQGGGHSRAQWAGRGTRDQPHNSQDGRRRKSSPTGEGGGEAARQRRALCLTGRSHREEAGGAGVLQQAP